MSTSTEDLLRKCVEKLNKEVAAGTANGAICENLWASARYLKGERWFDGYQEFDTMLINAILSWPESVAKVYPVPAPEEFADIWRSVNRTSPLHILEDKRYRAMAAFCYYNVNKGLWKGEYGESRKRLLAHITGQVLLLP